MLFTFSVLDQKHPFCANLVQKSKLFKLTFNTKTNSNKQNSMVVFTFSVLDEKHLFWANLVQRVKIVSLIWNLVPRLIQTCRIQWCCSLFLFYSGNTFFGQIWSKSQNCLFKLTFSAGTNSNKQNSVVVITFFVNLLTRLIWISRIQW